MIRGREEDGRLVVALAGAIDSASAAETEREIRALVQAHAAAAVVLDCDALTYVTSAGLRVILRLKQEVEDTVLINVHPDLYNVLEMTGFTDLMEVRRAYRTLSVEGCEVIGRGTNGCVYRIDRDTIVKVYENPDALPEIHRERELARMAFVAGVPTAIPYDVVRIRGGGFGSVFELLNAVSYARLLRDGEKTPEEAARMSIGLLRLIHSKTVESDALPDMRARALDWADFLRDHLPPAQHEKLRALIAAVPEDGHLIHGDYHVKNIMLMDGESLLIDMDTLSHGHPIFELASMYNAYEGFRLGIAEGQPSALGLPWETCRFFWRRSLALYLDTEDERRIDRVEAKAKILGLTRLLRREIRRDGLNREDGRRKIGIYRALLAELLPATESLVF